MAPPIIDEHQPQNGANEFGAKHEWRQSSKLLLRRDWRDILAGDRSPSDRQSLATAMRARCTEGELVGSRFRSVYWRVLLGVLPPQVAGWPQALMNSRRLYHDLRGMVVLEPRGSSAVARQSPTLVNPLSQDEENPWQQYFADADLRDAIERDVLRTFPEIEYFQTDSTRKVMQRVLFVYARHQPRVEYKQGMHEILGPLLFVLYCDQQTYAHSSEAGALDGLAADERKLLAVVMDDRYLENDAYAMFERIMSIIEPWYSAAVAGDGGAGDAVDPVHVKDALSQSHVVGKLSELGDKLLARIDPELHGHMSRLGVAPQVYGIRWLRLLFGREFSMQDLLLVWDAIFADGPPFKLADYIFVAMLVAIRDLLLHSDFTGVLNYVMRYPPTADVRSLLALALHLYKPAKHPAPPPASRHFSHITQTGRPHPNRQRDDVDSSFAHSGHVNLPKAVRLGERSIKIPPMLQQNAHTLNVVAGHLKQAAAAAAGSSPATAHRNVDGDAYSGSSRASPVPPAHTGSRRQSSQAVGLHQQQLQQTLRHNEDVDDVDQQAAAEAMGLARQQVERLTARLCDLEAVLARSHKRLKAIANDSSPATAAKLRPVIDDLSRAVAHSEQATTSAGKPNAHAVHVLDFTESTKRPSTASCVSNGPPPATPHSAPPPPAVMLRLGKDNELVEFRADALN